MCPIFTQALSNISLDLLWVTICLDFIWYAFYLLRFFFNLEGIFNAYMVNPFSYIYIYVSVWYIYIYIYIYIYVCVCVCVYIYIYINYLNMYVCCILTFDPAKHAIIKWCTGRKWHIPMASNRKKSRRRIWLTKWDKLKAHDTTHRLMHGKRVTSELHDSYFRLTPIKHAIPKIEWAIEWAIELLHNSVKTGSQWVGDKSS